MGTVLAMVNHSDRKNLDFGVMSFDYSNPGHVGVMRNFVPFYAAPGYKAPAVAGDE